MVNATVDNKPVSIILSGNQSTTVPSNETWRVSIHLSGRERTEMTINGLGGFPGAESSGGSPGNYLDVTLTGGQTIAEVEGNGKSAIFITGFVVNS